MDEKKKNDATSEHQQQQQREGQEAQSPQHHGDDDDGDDAVDGDGDTAQREGASHTKRAKEFSQAVAFEFVSDVIGSCLAGKR